MDVRTKLKSKIDSVSAWFFIFGLALFLGFWVIKTTQKVNAISNSIGEKSLRAELLEL